MPTLGPNLLMSKTGLGVGWLAFSNITLTVTGGAAGPRRQIIWEWSRGARANTSILRPVGRKRDRNLAHCPSMVAEHRSPSFPRPRTSCERSAGNCGHIGRIGELR